VAPTSVTIARCLPHRSSSCSPDGISMPGDCRPCAAGACTFCQAIEMHVMGACATRLPHSAGARLHERSTSRPVRAAIPVAGLVVAGAPRLTLVTMRFITDSNIAVPAVDEAQMREIDRIAVQETGPNLFQMMENAGRNLAELVMELAPRRSLLVLAG